MKSLLYGAASARTTLRASAAMLALTACIASIAQPAREASTLRIIVPFAAGTPTDVTARTIGQGLAKALDRPVVIDNRPGAAGGIGTEAVATAAPDGNTLLLTVNSTITINPHIYTKLRHDPMKDLVPLTLLATAPYLLVANPKAGYRSTAELIAAAKARPGTINYASYGAGSMPHMCAEIFQSLANVQLFHVPYKTGSLNDILGGQIPLGFEPIGPAIPHVQGQKLSALGVTSAKRIEALPEVAPVADAVPGYECIGWSGVLAPAKTPVEVRNALSAQILKVASTPEFARQMRDLGLNAQVADEKEFTQFVRKDYEKWGRIVKPLNIKLD